MPITLVTGLPGHGKTLYALHRFKDEAAKSNRPVFHNGINGLNIPGWTVWDVKDWQNLPAGAIFIVDECQQAFPIRGRGQPEEWIEMLARHRHLGIDFVIITQHPMLIDSFVRRLVDHHFHLVRKFGTHMATIHEFPNGVKETVDKSREGSIRHEWRYPKASFALYTSSELHTVKRRVPARVYVLASIPFILGALVYVAYQRLNPEAVAARSGVAAAVQEGSGAPTRTPTRTANAPARPMTPQEYAAAYRPRIEGLPSSAPVYDALTVPTVAPRVAACVQSARDCKCWSQQATPLTVTASLCAQIVAGGLFEAWGYQGTTQQPKALESSSIDKQPTVVPQDRSL